jgi:hypothetical protein
MELGICPTTKKGHNHAEVYSQPTGFKEVQALMQYSLTNKQHCHYMESRTRWSTTIHIRHP